MGIFLLVLGWIYGRFGLFMFMGGLKGRQVVRYGDVRDGGIGRVGGMAVDVGECRCRLLA